MQPSIENPRNLNRLHVQKYYRNHRRDIALRRQERACRAEGRVPRLQTIVEYDLPTDALITAFKEWHARTDDERRALKQAHRFRRVILALRSRNPSKSCVV